MKKINILAKLIVKIVFKHFDGSKKEIVKYIIQTVISILTAILTALGAMSCM